MSMVYGSAELFLSHVFRHTCIYPLYLQLMGKHSQQSTAQ
jgi:hypothetical protein